MSYWRQRNVVAVVFVLLAFIGMLVWYATARDDRHTRTLSDGIADAREGLVAAIEVRGNVLTVRMKNGQEYESRKERDTSIVEVLASNDVEVGGTDGIAVEVRGPSKFGSWLGILISFLPIFLIAGAVWWWATRRRG